MSYCRFGEGDVYVFLHVGGHLECCACSLQANPLSSFEASSTVEMIKHLEDHLKKGDTVPDSTFEDLIKDGDENDRWIAQKRCDTESSEDK